MKLSAQELAPSEKGRRVMEPETGHVWEAEATTNVRVRANIRVPEEGLPFRHENG